MICVSMSGENDIDARVASMPEEFGNDGFTDPPNIGLDGFGILVTRLSKVDSAASIDHHGPTIRKSYQCGITLPDVEKIDMQAAVRTGSAVWMKDNNHQKENC